MEIIIFIGIRSNSYDLYCLEHSSLERIVNYNAPKVPDADIGNASLCGNKIAGIN